MPMIVSPLFWEWFNLWLIQFLKDLYHEIKMVAQRGGNSSLNPYLHTCTNHGSQSQGGTIDISLSGASSMNVPSAGGQHLPSQINMQSLSTVSLQFVPQPPPPAANHGSHKHNHSHGHNHTHSHKHDQPTSRYSNSSCMPSSHTHHHYRLLPQSRPVECYHPSGAAGAGYMPSSSGGTQSPAQPSLRVQPTPPQPSAPPAPQQDMSKSTMSGHNFVSQNQNPPRPQYANYQFRATQHGTRPSSHPRQQQPFIPAAATTTGPVMYPTLVFQPTPMSMQTYQQPQSGTPRYYPYMGHYIGYNNPPSHTPPYYGYTANNAQLPAGGLAGGGAAAAARAGGALVGPQAAAAAAAPTTLPQPPPHMHHSVTGIRQSVPKRSHALPIIDPVTKQDILSNLYTNDSSYISTESNDRQTPQPEQTPTHSIAEEFNRMVNEAANQPSVDTTLIKSNYVHKNVKLPVSSTSTNQPQNNAISSMSPINNNVIKSDLENINDNRSPGADIVEESNETPVVSAISDSPVIVPKKPTQKSETTVQSVIVESSKNTVTDKVAPSKSEKASTPDVESASPAVTTNVVMSSTPVVTTAALPTHTQTATSAPAIYPITTAAPQPRERSHKSEEKEKEKDKVKDVAQEKEVLPAAAKQNGPVSVVISSTDSLAQAINPTTSQLIQQSGVDVSQKLVNTKQPEPTQEPANIAAAAVVEPKVEPVLKKSSVQEQLTPTELLSASIEKIVRDQSHTEQVPEKKSSAFEAQAKLTQSISSVCRTHQSEPKMKDINQTADPDTANGNTADVTKSEVKEDINKNEKAVKNSKNNNKKAAKMATANNDVTSKESGKSCENGKDETDQVVVQESIEEPQVKPAPEEEEKMIDKPADINVAPVAPAPPNPQPAPPPMNIPTYKYGDDQWSPLNKTGKKSYDLGLLKQIRESPLTKDKPSNAPLLDMCNLFRTSPLQEPLSFTPILRQVNDSLFPPFAKGGGIGGSRNPPSTKKDGRNMPSSGKGSVKMASPSSNSSQKPVIHVSLSLRDEVKLKESESAWKPTRFRKDALSEEEQKTQELYKKFRGILNKLTPQKFDTLLDKVKSLEINNQKRLEGVIGLVFEKAIDEPNFSEAYATMCNKLSMLKVPADNATNPDQCVNFRALIITKCQQQFEANKTDEQVLKLEKEYAECTDPNKKKELHLMLQEENRRVRMRSVGNVRFIGELYKLKMLTPKIMDYCMNYLIDKLEEEKLECLCKLLTTIGEQIENEETSQLDKIFKKMQDIVDRKSNKISSRVKFMIQDVIELRRRRWVVKSVIDSQPKMMDQIQKEADQYQRNIELMNASPIGGGFRRDDGNRGKRGGDNRRQNSFMDNTWKTTKTTNFSVDTSKLKAAGTQKILTNIKLAPQHTHSAWNHGSGTKTQTQIASNSNSLIGLTKSNKYSVLENVQTDPSTLRANRDMTPTYHSKGASIERSTFSPRGDFLSAAGGNKSGSVGVARSNSGTRSQSSAPATPPALETPAPPPAVAQEPITDEKMKNSVKSTINLCLLNSDIVEFATDVKQLFPPQYHATVVGEVLNVVLEKNAKEVGMIANSLLHLVSTNTISSDNFLRGLKETFEFAPDLYIDIPMLYEYLGKIVAPHIEKKHITFVQIFDLCESIISNNHGSYLLKAIITVMNESMGPTFVKSKWQESGLQLSKWMKDDQVAKWIEDNKFEFLQGAGGNSSDESKKILTPAETQSRLLQLMNTDENCECIKGWVQDKLGKASNEDWFMRALIQAICEHALYGNENRDVPHFNQDRMSKYASLINEFGESKEAREASCLFGIQHLIHRLEHPQGLTLEIFQYLHEQYLISLDGFLSWEQSDKEPEGKGVMMMALTSFFTNIKEVDVEDSCSED